jgi:hypothetical protein
MKNEPVTPEEQDYIDAQIDDAIELQYHQHDRGL